MNQTTSHSEATEQSSASAILSAKIQRIAALTEERLVKVEERAMRAEAKLASIEARLAALSAHPTPNSTSWRIGAPLRLLGTPARRPSSAIRENRLASGIKRRVKALVNHVARVIARHPQAKRLAIAALSMHPVLHRRIRAMLAPPSTYVEAGGTSPLNTSPDWRPLTFDDLPPEARRIYIALRAATQG
ncbi:hypothetical protein [Methylovirgula sp. 4M-Z18]|uniref:hypothetical protein n=1 Tax=Methylovirgula sp. 4M-Z18 TaxID=2293567 RepID=UPI000E36F25D|nr:hypothetical protein [Methylovirgula sp. 4M-Z18]RFB78393.1 hypothetical protein DYH55_16765 [Methylovirgula sp. 4M-Z18]